MADKPQNVTRFLLRHAVIGAVGACGAVGLMIATDFASLRTLVLANDAGFLALGVMTVFFAITFSSVQMGMALMLASNEDEEPPTGRKEEPALPPTRLAVARIPIR